MRCLGVCPSSQASVFARSFSARASWRRARRSEPGGIARAWRIKLDSVSVGSITINGVSNLGYATSYPRLNPSEQRFQIADNLSWTSGKHTMKVGGAMRMRIPLRSA